MEVRVLGPLQAVAGDRVIALSRPKQRAVLAALALRPRQVVSSDWLILEIWGEAAQSSATGSLHNTISQLRKLLGAGVLRTQAPGYALDVEPDCVDAVRFERLVREARGRPSIERAEMLRDALALWRGPALADLADERFARDESMRLAELRLAATEARIEAELELGLHVDVVGELEALVLQEPLRERPRKLLMLALYRSGRHAEALAVGRDARRMLLEEHGLDPSPELQQLEQAILNQDRALDAPALPRAEPTPVPSSGVADRRMVTVLFADVVDSTDLGARLDPESLAQLMRSYFDAARSALERHGGTVEKFVGDAVMAVFGIPHQHEDDALRAVRAAVELRDAVDALTTDLELRIGVNTGEVLAGDTAGGQSFATGHTVNAAKRLEQAAGAGGILVGAGTYQLVKDAVLVVPADPVRIGRAALKAFQVEGVLPGAAGVARRLDAPLVGRSEEVALVRAALAEAMDSGRCRALTVLGEVGIGKTRLGREIGPRLGGVRVVEGRCVPYGEGATYLPVVDLVRRAAGDVSEAAIAAVLGEGDDAALAASQLAALAGAGDQPVARGEAFWAVRAFVEAIGRDEPAVVLLDDVHWAEPALLDLVEYLADRATAPVLILCLARPDLLDERPDWSGATSAVSLIRLGPLSEDESRILLGRLGDEGIETGTRERIVALAEGNALHLEQLLAYVAEDGSLEQVPPTVEAVLAGRLDRLEPRALGVLRRASVVGREFSRRAVAALAEDEVDEPLLLLARKGFVRPERSPGTDDAYRFHHVLLRDVAYAGLTKQMRAELHERAAAWLDRDGPGPDELVGYHLEQAHRCRAELSAPAAELADLAEAAGHRLGEAGIHAAKQADASAAAKLLGRARDLLAPGARKAELLCELAQALRSIGDGDGSDAALEEAREIAESIEAVTVIRRVTIERSYLAAVVRGADSIDSLLAIIAEAIPLLEAHGDDRTLGRTWSHAGDAHSMSLNNRAWADAARRAAFHLTRAGWSASNALQGEAAALKHGPTPVRQAISRCRELLAEADHNRIARAGISVHLGALLAMDDKLAKGRDLMEDARRIYEEFDQKLPLAINWAPNWAQLLLLQGLTSEAEVVLRAACEDLARMRQIAYLSSLSSELAEVLLAVGGDGVPQLIEHARALAPGDDVWSQALWRVAAARLQARTGDARRAEELSAQAFRLVQKTDALNFRARISVAVADVLRQLSKEAEAHAFLLDAVRLYEEKGNRAALDALGAQMVQSA